MQHNTKQHMAPLIAAALTEAELAKRWSLSVKTLQEWRKRGDGPKFLKLGKAVRYPLADIEAYETANRKQSTAAA